MNKEVELPALDVHSDEAMPFIMELADDFGFKAASVRDHVRADDDSPRCMYAQKAVQLLAQVTTLTAQLEELEHYTSLCPEHEEHCARRHMPSTTCVRCLLTKATTARYAAEGRADAAEAELAALQDGATVTYRPNGHHSRYGSKDEVENNWPGFRIIEVRERILDATETAKNGDA